MFSKSTSLYFIIPTITIPLLTNLQLALVLMFIAYVVDFATGILASYIEQKKNPQVIKFYFIQSSKLRKSVVKAITYMVMIGGVFLFEKAFFIKKFHFSHVSEQDLTVTLIATAFCFAIEFFSVLENLKRSGFDIIENGKKMVKVIKSLCKFSKS